MVEKAGYFCVPSGTDRISGEDRFFCTDYKAADWKFSMLTNNVTLKSPSSFFFPLLSLAFLLLHTHFVP